MPSLSLTVWFTAFLLGLATAQNASSLGPIPSSIDSAEKASWCTAQFQNCPYLCGGKDFTEFNVCKGADVTNYICACNNGSSPPPDIAQYFDTIPNQVCVAEYAQCVHDNPGSPSCKTCGKLDPKKIPASVQSTSSSSASSTQASSTSAAPATTTSASTQGNNAARGKMDVGAVLGALAAAGALL